jgi:hypothetical protein
MKGEILFSTSQFRTQGDTGFWTLLMWVVKITLLDWLIKGDYLIDLLFVIMIRDNNLARYQIGDSNYVGNIPL